MSGDDVAHGLGLDRLQRVGLSRGGGVQPRQRKEVGGQAARAERGSEDLHAAGIRKARISGASSVCAGRLSAGGERRQHHPDDDEG